MKVTEEGMIQWCRALLGADPSLKKLSLHEYLAAIPELDSLNDVAPGTPVLVRGDLDAKPGPKIGEGDERLRSMLDTLKFGIEKGWKQIVFGHIGRKPEGTLKAVAARLGELLNCEVPLITDWLDESTLTIPDAVTRQVRDAKPGGILMLENTRKYEIERALWKATLDDLPQLAPKLAKVANEFAEKLGTVYVNEALSAGSLDTSTTVVPAAMDRVALGRYVAGQFKGPMLRCIQAQVVIFSGLKIDKLDDLEAMINRGTVRWVFSAGSLAMALKKAQAELNGEDFCLGVAGDPAHKDKPYYIPPERIEQAERMLATAREKGIEFILPVDFVLQDCRVAEKLGPGDQQLDVGPKTRALFEQKLGEILEHARRTGTKLNVFHNGVFGMFEDPRFEEGTRHFVGQFKRMKEAGAEVYVGGGEGGTALAKYGEPDRVTHCFTAGGTVLNALGSEPVPYLVALRMAALRRSK